MTDQPALERLDTFIVELQQIREIEAPVMRARALRALSRRAQRVLGNAGNEAVTLAANELVAGRRPTHADLAQKLGVTRYRVSNAITDYRAWVTAQVSDSEAAS
jgi:hypothetical protein